jgi:non-heme chloroperoxidase
VLLVWGDADGLVDREMQQVLRDTLPNATLHTYAGIGHTPRWEAPDRFVADVVAFVEDLG